MNTFNRDEIATLLALGPGARDGENVDVLTNFDSSRVFNLVGTNPGDYKSAAGLSSVAVGDASDGLVRIKNATTRGRTKDGFTESPQAFVHRSHSGVFGIVNSEEGYQNLIRFLYGDIRADGRLEIDELTLPAAVQKLYDEGHNVKASYVFEVALSLRGKPWQLHRRTASENSAIFRRYADLFEKPADPALPRAPKRAGSPVLFNAFLDMSQSQTGTTLSFALDLCVRVPEYVVDGVLFLKDHYEGGYLYRDTILFEARPPKTQDEQWLFDYWFANNPGAGRQRAAIVEESELTLSFEVPIVQPHRPGIAARLRVTTSYWNDWN